MLFNKWLKTSSEDTLRAEEKKLSAKLDNMEYGSKKSIKLANRHVDIVQEISSRSSGKLPRREHGWYLPSDDED